MNGVVQSFRYENPTRVHFGRGAIEHLAAELRERHFERVLFLFGGGSIRANGVYERVRAQLDQVGADVVELGGVRGNPVLSHVREGVQLARNHRVDVVCGVGGGSVVDAAKAIAVGARLEGDVWQAFDKTITPSSALPTMAVLTLPATGSEMNGVAVVTNEETNDKSAIVMPGLLNPCVSFLDPETTYTLSPRQTAFACTDILSHLMEAYLTTSADHLLLQDPLMEGVARGVIEAMKVLQTKPHDYDARAAFMWGATLAWSGISQLGVPGWGMPSHALEMPLSAVHDVAHGAGLSVVIPAWMRVMGAQHATRILRFSRCVLSRDVSSPEAAAEALLEFYRGIGSPTTFAEAGISNPDLEQLVDLAERSFVARGMTDYDRATILRIYSAAL